MMVTSWILGLVIGVGGDQPSRPAEVRGDLAHLQGKWVAKAGPRGAVEVSLEVSGRDAHFAVALPGGQRLEADGRVELDESVPPRAVDWVDFRGPDDRELPRIPAIYRLENGEFTVCSGGLSSGRPRAFTRGDGILSEVTTFRRPEAETRGVAGQ